MIGAGWDAKSSTPSVLRTAPPRLRAGEQMIFLPCAKRGGGADRRRGCLIKLQLHPCSPQPVPVEEKGSASTAQRGGATGLKWRNNATEQCSTQMGFRHPPQRFGIFLWL